MIRGFQDRHTKAVFNRERVRRWSRPVQRQAQMKLMVLNSATDLNDLRKPPGNRLKALDGDRLGQHAIRINDQWRVCFVWSDGGAERVEITDYH
ncbi:MAG: type II toxin-antitoxin system RelE/ParE family toxin [Spirochaetaceae bacterium]|nr:type II toxin-antitoxin system RelE/ParE family toxin [Spirochaetaceae bacterium]